MYLKLIYSATDSQRLELPNETNVQFIKTEDMESARASFPDSQQCEIPERDITWAYFSRVGRKGKIFSEFFSFSCIKHNSFEPPRSYVGG